MADSIKIGNITVDKFYLGPSDDVQIYLGTVKLYPQDTPVTTSYLTFVVRDVNACFKLSGASNTVSYSIDNGTTWTTLASNEYSPVVLRGSTIMWKMTNPSINTDNGIGRFYTSGGTFDVEGNIMSLLYGDNFEGQTALQGDSQFRGLFDGNTSVINASGLTLPATAMTANCYRSMFGNCSNLVSTPTELPATSMANGCYYYMFARTSITSAPTLSATTLVDSCYESMFSNCLSLTAVTCLATTNIVSDNTNNMFLGITTTGTFERASGAIWVCEAGIPSTWSITPAYTPQYRWRTSTDATDYCCDTTAHTKYYKNYYQVSNNNGCTYVDVTPAVTAQSTSVIEYNSVDCGYVPQYFTITSYVDSNTITLTNNSGRLTTSFQYSLDSGTTWNSFLVSTGEEKTIATLASGATLMMKGTNNTLGTAYNKGHYFRGTGNYMISGEISSLVNGNATDRKLSGKGSYTFAQLFSGDTHLVSAENLKISSTELPPSCFNGTFRACTRLVKAPDLSVPTVLGKEAYSSMFEGCIALAYPPTQLYFTSAKSDSYNRMFCMSRTSKLATPAMTYTPKMFGNWGGVTPVSQQMFCGNGNLTNIYCYWTNASGSFSNFSGALTNWVNYTADSGVTFTKRSTQSFASDVNGIKTGWTVVNDDTTQPS